MKKIFIFITTSIILLIIAAFSYGAVGYFDAVRDADNLEQRAAKLMREGRSGASLGEIRYRQLLAVQDPQFEHHSGVDMMTAGAGTTTITQSLAKRVGFENFTPGITKIRQTGYALGLESTLSKEQIMALWLDTLEMGTGPNGWITGFHQASQTIFEQQPNEIDEQQFLSLVAVLIAPSRYRLGTDDDKLKERVDRISKLVSGSCAPKDSSDVWLEACADS
ncbi:transglycosylase domain-containing protein [Ahrensia sp. 13_GOM-1096m]|uniref:transglycosylase domain-containing protein n=1 Tax=Ahrensia sp. 13_GOM-1096m TaxID=1380380 RepID=UPI000550F9CC|nr:transglycosylase domain-containing protein [Ahrensia sp. 13_GOM-1096m]